MNNNAILTDEEIIEKVRSGDPELYTVILERYQSKLLRFANNIIKDENKAEDAVQASFVKAYININSFNTKKKFSSWIYRIVHNETVNIIKKYFKEIPLPDVLDFKSNENIEKNFEKKEFIIQIENCLKKIPLLYSGPLSLYFIEEKTHEEISDILRIPMGTVAIRISRAKILMKKICQKI